MEDTNLLGSVTDAPYGITFYEDCGNLNVVYRAGDGKNIMLSGINEGKKVINLTRPSMPLSQNVEPVAGNKLNPDQEITEAFEENSTISMVFDDRDSLRAFIKFMQRSLDRWEEE